MRACKVPCSSQNHNKLDMAAAAHLILIVIAAIIAAFLTAVLADGRSIIVLKDGTLPLVTNPAVVNASLTFLMGKT